MKSVSIMTFNIMHGLDYKLLHDEKKRVLRYDLVSELVKKYNPDILCVNEIYGKGFNKDSIEFYNHVQELKNLINYPYSNFSKAIDTKNGEYGNALFSKLDFKVLNEVKIPDPIIKEEDVYYESRVMTKYAFDGFNVIHTHFGLAKSEQKNAYDTFKSLLDDNKTIFLGDFNIKPDNYIIKDLQNSFTEASIEKYGKVVYTHRTIDPSMKIDYIFYKDFELEDCKVIEEVVSDHYPIYTKLKY